jgi:hypothetical protein
MGLRHFNKLFKRYIYKSIHYGLHKKYGGKRKSKRFKKLSLSKKKRYLRLLRKKKIKNFYRLQRIINSYKRLYIFFSFLDKFFRLIPTYPTNMFNKMAYKILFRFFRMYFVFKPY